MSLSLSNDAFEDGRVSRCWGCGKRSYESGVVVASSTAILFAERADSCTAGGSAGSPAIQWAGRPDELEANVHRSPHCSRNAARRCGCCGHRARPGS